MLLGRLARPLAPEGAQRLRDGDAGLRRLADLPEVRVRAQEVLDGLQPATAAAINTAAASSTAVVKLVRMNGRGCGFTETSS